MKKTTLLITIIEIIHSISYGQGKLIQDSSYVKIISGHITGKPYIENFGATITVIIDSIAKYHNYKVKYNLTKPITGTYSGRLALAVPIDSILSKQSRIHKEFKYTIKKDTIIVTNYN